jgi:hypothetical protein
LNALARASNHDSTVPGSVTEAVIELLRSALDLLKHAYNGVSLTERFVSKVHAKFVESSLQPRSAVDKKLCIGDIVFLTEFPQKSFRERENSGCEVSTMPYSVDRGIDRCVNAEPLSVDVDPRLVQRYLLRRRNTGRFESGLLDPIVQGRPATLDTQERKEAGRYSGATMPPDALEYPAASQIRVRFTVH